MLFGRTALSRQPEATIRRDLWASHNEDHDAPDLAFRDPDLLDFLELAASYSEKDPESEILD